jgi:hypothetical protein
MPRNTRLTKAADDTIRRREIEDERSVECALYSWWLSHCLTPAEETGLARAARRAGVGKSEYSRQGRKARVAAITGDGMSNESAAPVGDAAKMEVAWRIVGARVQLLEEESLGSIPPPTRLIRHVYSLH